MINGFKDLENPPDSRSSTQPICQRVLSRARDFSTRISFALAVFPMAPDTTTLDSWTYKDFHGRHVPASNASIARWQSGLERCFSFAVRSGFTELHILGHWDPLHPVLLRPTTWRNLMEISPRQIAAAGFSYVDVMVTPVLAALDQAASPGVNVLFSVSGEMGLSNYVFAPAWRGVLRDARARLQRSGWKSVQLAVALNWQMFCGCIAAANPAPGAFDPLVYNATFASAFAGVKQYALPYVPAFKGLLEDGDYVGVSGYGSGYPTSTAVLSWRDIERPLQTLAYELGLFGISLKALTQRRPILYVEQGLGGVLRYGLLPAPDLATVARYPASGNWPVEGYSAELDPWRRTDFAKYRRAFYNATLAILRRGQGEQYRLDGAFVWSVGSFDIFGVHPVSSSSGGSFADTSIARAAAQLNGVA